MSSEISFPRGGPTQTRDASKVHKRMFSSKNNPKKCQPSKPQEDKVQIEHNDEDDSLQTVKVDSLTYKSVQEGMLVLGRIRDIYNIGFDVSLPGRIYGYVQIVNVSKPYNDCLQEFINNGSNSSETKPTSLSDLFKRGQFVPTKVLEKKVNDNNSTRVQLSVNPSDINSDINYRAIQRHMLLWGAVSGAEDHGYVIDLGIANCRTFLPNSNVDKDASYIVGQTIWCLVIKVDILPAASTVTVTAKTEQINKTVMTDELNLHYVVPGTKFNVVVEKIMKNGLQVKFHETLTGYVSNTQLLHPFDNLKKYKEQDVVEARLLYVAPITKFCYLTLRSLKADDNVELEPGDLCIAKVLAKTNGIYVALNNNKAKGFISFKRLKNNNKIMDGDIVKYLSKTYPINSAHQVRITEYNPMEQMYICSAEETVVKEKIFNVDDLQYGVIYAGHVKDAKDNGVEVKVGNVSGFIPNIHLSDIVLSNEAIHKKFSIGKKVQVRMWKRKTSNNNLLFTARPSLIQSEDCFWSMDNVVVNKPATGVVSCVLPKGIVVGFYDSLKGWLAFKTEEESINRNLYCRGQTIKTTICSIKEKGLILTIDEPRLSKRKRVRLGQKVSAKVKCAIEDSGLEVSIVTTGVHAFIPTAHLSSSLSLCRILLDTFEVGDCIKDLICIETSPKLILSLRESLAYERFGLHVPKFDNLNVGDILRCSFAGITGNELVLSSPIHNYTKKVHVDLSNVADAPIHNWNNLLLSPEQSILAKITNIDKEQKEIEAVTKLSAVYHFDLNVALDILDKYMEDLKLIKSNLLLKNDPIAQYSCGQHATATIVNIVRSKEGGCILKLDNNVQAIARKSHCPKNIKVGNVVNCVILWINYTAPVVEVSLDPRVLSKISKNYEQVSDLRIDTTVKARVILSREDMPFIVAAVKLTGNRHLIYLPMFCSENDWSSKIPAAFAVEDTQVKVVIKRVTHGKAIGLCKEMIKIFTKRQIDNEQRSSKHNKIKPLNEVDSMDVDSTDEDVKEHDKKHSKKYNKNKAKRTVDVVNLSDDADAGEMISDEGYTDDITTDEEESDNDTTKDVDVSENGSKRKRKLTFNDSVRCKYIKVDKELNECSSNEISLSGAEGFYNSSELMNNETVSSESDDEHTDDGSKSKKKKLTTAEKIELAKQEEERIMQRENELLNLPSNPENPDQFERMILANPNNSQIWIKYIAFHVSLTEIEKARSILKRALDTIIFKEEQERFNLWLARLNLENSYGTKETFDTTLREAVQFNDSLEMNLKAIQILAESNKIAELEEKVRVVLRNKEFKIHSKVWIHIAKAYYSCNLLEKGRKLLQQAFESLPKRDHINLMVQFALMDFSMDNTEYGESLFQKVTSICPQRVDVWCTYVDQLIKKGRPDLARNVLERAAVQKLPARKMKTIYNKFLEFEKEHGDTNSLLKVRKMAEDYVEKAHS